jgi:hypothetical protein
MGILGAMDLQLSAIMLILILIFTLVHAVCVIVAVNKLDVPKLVPILVFMRLCLLA